jgi:predicted O-methyltransferase YrrM
VRIESVPQALIDTSPVAGPFSKYLNWRETELLIGLANIVRPRVLIEFGVNEGVTARRVLDNVPTLERYIGIDVPQDYVTPLQCQRAEVPEDAGVYAASDPRFWLLTVVAPLTADQLEPCDCAFIDGDHSAIGVLRDSELARELVRPGGMIVWHDHGNHAAEVTQVLEALAEDRGWPIKAIANSWLAFCRINNGKT